MSTYLPSERISFSFENIRSLRAVCMLCVLLSIMAILGNGEPQTWHTQVFLCSQMPQART